MRPDKVTFQKDYIYHIFTRSLDHRKIFENKADNLRFIFQMYAANVGNPIKNLQRKDVAKAAQALLVGQEISEGLIANQHPHLVNIASFALVSDHVHFLLGVNREDGISKYMQKLKLGFAKYFNLKYKRTGNLFARPYQVVPVTSDAQLTALIFYINIKNPLDIWQPGWKEKGVRDWDKFFNFLEDYQFSSFPDLFGKRRSTVLAPRSWIEKWMGGDLAMDKEGLKKLVRTYLQNKMKAFDDLFVEN